MKRNGSDKRGTPSKRARKGRKSGRRSPLLRPGEQMVYFSSSGPCHARNATDRSCYAKIAGIARGGPAAAATTLLRRPGRPLSPPSPLVPSFHQPLSPSCVSRCRSADQVRVCSAASVAPGALWRSASEKEGGRCARESRCRLLLPAATSAASTPQSAQGGRLCPLHCCGRRKMSVRGGESEGKKEEREGKRRAKERERDACERE